MRSHEERVAETKRRMVVHAPAGCVSVPHRLPAAAKHTYSYGILFGEVYSQK